ncbi:MAG: hypothetical protein IKK11_01560, partial [Oscillospiraceae bacterium]|nr:hypothetical protein [Oscillospiraceae bacterium]
ALRNYPRALEYTGTNNLTYSGERDASVIAHIHIHIVKNLPRYTPMVFILVVHGSTIHRRSKMKKTVFVCFLAVLFLMVGCNAGKKPSQGSDETTAHLEKITVNNKVFSINEINNGIRDVFNTQLYYYPDGLLNQFAYKQIEYDLYFSSRQVTPLSFPLVYIFVTNVEHPLSTEQSPRLYRFGVCMTEYGLQSYFYESGAFFISPQEKWGTCPPEGTKYLGHYSMDLSRITQPIHEEMTDQWKQGVETSVRLYMDNNNFYREDSKNLQEGKYNVYIQGFSQSDVDSTIIFEHENGQVYQGRYYFVHEVAEGKPADLNHVERIEDVDAAYIEYLDKLKKNAAFHMVYDVVGQEDSSIVP